MDKYILGTLQELDAPKVGQLAHSTALGNYMTGFTKDKGEEAARRGYLLLTQRLSAPRLPLPTQYAKSIISAPLATAKR
ncbi:MAG: hypothetical protein V8Q85_01325 [Christensenellales bacterium]